MSGQGHDPDVARVAADTGSKKDFFVSYNKADREWAEWIAWQLELGGYSTVIQAWDFRPGSNFVLEMQRAAEQAERTIAVLSPEFLDSRFTAPEWSAAFARDPTGTRGLLVPVRVRACEPGGLIPQITYIDLLGTDDRSVLRERLLEGVRRERAKPVTEPPLPALAGLQGLGGGLSSPDGVTVIERFHRSGAPIRIARVAAMALVIGIGLHWFLRSAVPNLMDEVNALSAVAPPSIVAAIALEWLVRVIARQRAYRIDRTDTRSSAAEP